MWLLWEVGQIQVTKILTDWGSGVNRPALVSLKDCHSETVDCKWNIKVNRVSVLDLVKYVKMVLDTAVVVVEGGLMGKRTLS